MAGAPTARNMWRATLPPLCPLPRPPCLPRPSTPPSPPISPPQHPTPLPHPLSTLVPPSRPPVSPPSSPSQGVWWGGLSNGTHEDGAAAHCPYGLALRFVVGRRSRLLAAWRTPPSWRSSKAWRTPAATNVIQAALGADRRAPSDLSEAKPSFLKADFTTAKCRQPRIHGSGGQRLAQSTPSCRAGAAKLCPMCVGTGQSLANLCLGAGLKPSWPTGSARRDGYVCVSRRSPRLPRGESNLGWRDLAATHYASANLVSHPGNPEVRNYPPWSLE